RLPARGRAALPAERLVAVVDSRRVPARGTGGPVGAPLDLAHGAGGAWLRVDERERRVEEFVESVGEPRHQTTVVARPGGAECRCREMQGSLAEFNTKAKPPAPEISGAGGFVRRGCYS